MKEVQPTFSFDEEGMKKFKAYTLKSVFELKNDIICAIKYRNYTISTEGADRTLMDSLKELQDTVVSYDTLEVTGIGRTLNGLRNHPSEKIRELSRSIVTKWRQMVDECIKYDRAVVTATATAAAAAARNTRSDIGNTTARRESNNKRSRPASLKVKLVLKKKQPPQQQKHGGSSSSMRRMNNMHAAAAVAAAAN